MPITGHQRSCQAFFVFLSILGQTLPARSDDYAKMAIVTIKVHHHSDWPARLTVRGPWTRSHHAVAPGTALCLCNLQGDSEIATGGKETPSNRFAHSGLRGNFNSDISCAPSPPPPPPPPPQRCTLTLRGGHHGDDRNGRSVYPEKTRWQDKAV